MTNGHQPYLCRDSDGAAHLNSGAMCDAGASDKIIDQCLLLLSRRGDNAFAVGTAVVLGAHTWNRGDECSRTVIAVTARHCLTNLHEHFNVPIPNPLWPGQFQEERIVHPTWTLVGGREVNGEQALWNCIWSCYFLDDLALLYLRPVNAPAKNALFRQPLICFGLPHIGDELWGFGFANCRDVAGEQHDFETGLKLTKGRVIQHFVGTSREERLSVALPLISGMSGGPVFWAKMLVGIISSTLPALGAEGTVSSVTRIRQIVNVPLTNAPAIADRRYDRLLDLATDGIINIMGPTVARQDEVVLVNRHQLSLYVRMM